MPPVTWTPDLMLRALRARLSRTSHRSLGTLARSDLDGESVLVIFRLMTFADSLCTTTLPKRRTAESLRERRPDGEPTRDETALFLRGPLDLKAI